ncbi:MAG: DUF1801 domain-containing protein [Coriobacteriia bacterium]|nr:DUF1801 domain-containing protein [Coriobacteriia bacterium]
MTEDNAATKPAREPTKKKLDGLAGVLETIAAMPEHDQAMAKRFHSIIERTAPSLTPRLWYGMQAYAKDGKVLCFFQSASKFKARYATFGFEEVAELDDGAMWPTSYALTELGDEQEAEIEKLIRKAMGEGVRQDA